MALGRSQATRALRWPGGSTTKPLSGHLMPYLVSSSVHLLEAPQTNCSTVWWEGKGWGKMNAESKTLILCHRPTKNTFVHTLFLFPSLSLSSRLSLPLTGGLALSSFDPPILIPYSWERECGQIVSDPNSRFVSWKKWESTTLSRTYTEFVI